MATAGLALAGERVSTMERPAMGGLLGDVIFDRGGAAAEQPPRRRGKCRAYRVRMKQNRKRRPSMRRA